MPLNPEHIDIRHDRLSHKLIGHPNTVALLLSAAEAEAYKIIPGHLTREKWNRNLLITAHYFLQPKTLAEIGQSRGATPETPLTSEGIRQIVAKTVAHLWANHTKHDYKEFPIKQFPLDRRFDPHGRFGRHLSEITLGILESAEHGATYEELRTIATSTQLGVVRKGAGRLRHVNVPFSPAIERGKRLEKDLPDAIDNTEIRNLLDEIKSPALYEKLHQSSHRIILTVSAVARKHRYYVKESEITRFVQALDEAKIPFGSIERTVQSGPHKGTIQRRYFIAAQHFDRAGDAFRTNPELNEFTKNPVMQLKTRSAAIPIDALPTLWQLQKHKDGYRSLKKLADRLDIHRGQYAELMNENCPVTIFRGRITHYYHERDEEALAEYLLTATA
ncbi:hypothetical protein A2Z00_03660 [Candidatus Gottesmanbacteria bacterium RBG_13_45_10]|uniref:Uncharacterized protein n=1 Tax=Candidatus Gottesmanbacteria bacterium RBG_13_45_10 TaxID=1798370 RepID=A0A1F5ZHB1_9BACT|nr:MAG: hypothetical protein A2Z00_03660 [Candidatus Gottesmanbacteria bacterium RBG_13_45_10]